MGTTIRGVRFRSVWGASGVQGFFGEGYWFHKYLKLVGMWLWGITFVSKTTTWHEREGNMPRDKTGMRPKEQFPKCVYVNFRKRIVLNAVGLSGPGAHRLLNSGRWQRRTVPFFISFMSVASTLEAKLAEFQQFVWLLGPHLPYFLAEIGLQINISCPNVGVHSDDIVKESHAMLDIAGTLGIPVIVKITLTTSVEQALRIAYHPACDGICLTNTVPFGSIPSYYIDWQSLFGGSAKEFSPLIKRGLEQPGGLSGKPLLPLVIDWVKDARKKGFAKHINAGGGILGPIDAIRVFNAGADSISLGTISMLAPWAVLPTVVTGHIMGILKQIRKNG